MMSEENIKHSSEAAILKQIDHAEKINMKLFKNMRIIAKLTRLGARIAQGLVRWTLRKKRGYSPSSKQTTLT